MPGHAAGMTGLTLDVNEVLKRGGGSVIEMLPLQVAQLTFKPIQLEKLSLGDYPSGLSARLNS